MSTRRPKDWLARKLRRHMPTREAMAENRYLAPIAHRFLSPELWRFTRRSVPRGVALGLFAAFIVPIGQIFLAAFLALPARANVPLAAATTFVTNPFTLPFWLYVANRTGAFILDIDAAVSIGAGHLARDQGMLARMLEMGGVTAFGFVVLSIVSASIGYLVSSFVWKRIVFAKRRRRLTELEARLDRRLRGEAE
ncbi:DUF2062 domain-containing protein [Qipengyuania sp.]|uniref:DUF2062 domain-containing protein n=1 Tax=Qipengyuania sp. TaxID=2004515 RepID=UPI00373561D2